MILHSFYLHPVGWKSILNLWDMKNQASSPFFFLEWKKGLFYSGQVCARALDCWI